MRLRHLHWEEFPPRAGPTRSSCPSRENKTLVRMVRLPPPPLPWVGLRRLPQQDPVGMPSKVLGSRRANDGFVTSKIDPVYGEEDRVLLGGQPVIQIGRAHV